MFTFPYTGYSLTLSLIFSHNSTHACPHTHECTHTHTDSVDPPPFFPLLKKKKVWLILYLILTSSGINLYHGSQNYWYNSTWLYTPLETNRIRRRIIRHVSNLFPKRIEWSSHMNTTLRKLLWLQWCSCDNNDVVDEMPFIFLDCLRHAQEDFF